MNSKVLSIGSNLSIEYILERSVIYLIISLHDNFCEDYCMDIVLYSRCAPTMFPM